MKVCGKSATPESCARGFVRSFVEEGRKGGVGGGERAYDGGEAFDDFVIEWEVVE